MQMHSAKTMMIYGLNCPVIAGSMKHDSESFTIEKCRHSHTESMNEKFGINRKLA